MKPENLSLFKLADFNPPGNIYVNLSPEMLEEHILQKGEGRLADNGALMVDTGKFTGRSPDDKYFVDEDSSSQKLWWGKVNQKISEKIFDELLLEVLQFYNRKNTDTYLFEGSAGDDPVH